MRYQFHRYSKGRIIENFSWVAASSRLESTVTLLRLDNSHLRTPDDNLGWRYGVLATRKSAEWVDAW